MASAATLNGWKEIAAFLGRGVRTVQRWERDLGLAVHRPKGSARSAVLAFAEELDAWLHQTPLGFGKANGRGDTRLCADSPALTMRQEELWRVTRALRQASAKLRNEHISVRARNKELRAFYQKRLLELRSANSQSESS